MACIYRCVVLISESEEIVMPFVKKILQHIKIAFQMSRLKNLFYDHLILLRRYFLQAVQKNLTDGKSIRQLNVESINTRGYTSNESNFRGKINEGRPLINFQKPYIVWESLCY